MGKNASGKETKASPQEYKIWLSDTKIHQTLSSCIIKEKVKKK